MAQKFTSLTGRWLGRYEYPSGGEPVPFEAELTEDIGLLDGMSSESNTFRPDMGETLDAMLSGERIGAAVQFAKRYLGFDQQDALSYDGTVNAALTRIEGHWSFAPPVQSSGRFVMMRKPQASARAARTQSAERALEFTNKA